MTAAEWKEGLGLKCLKMQAAAQDMNDYIEQLNDVTDDEQEIEELAEYMMLTLMLMNIEIDAILN